MQAAICPRITALLTVPLTAAALLAAGTLPAAAAPAGGVLAAVTSLNQVINSITVWLTRIADRHQRTTSLRRVNPAHRAAAGGASRNVTEPLATTSK